MYFNSLTFIYFLPVVFGLFYIISHKYRVFILLLASYYFYASWNPAYLSLILISTFTDYFAGLSLERVTKKSSRKLILWSSLVINLGMLIYFKYANFFIDTFNRVNYKAGSPFESIQLLDIILPVGISFYTFQTISYTIDVYNQKIKPEKNIAYFALYVSFFAQLVAGPIERFSDLIQQFKQKAYLTRENLSHGFRLILYGFFMKMVVADNIGIIVDNTYQNISTTSSFNLIIAACLYSFQILCDFHGYSTIAIGVAKLFDINLSGNFKAPYFSPSLTIFWRKWHITLTSWFRDYIYYPLGGNKGSKLKWMIAIMIVFIISGFWHGAQWTFIVWGALHGGLTLLEKIIGADKKSTSKLVNTIRSLFIFGLVSILWIFFRSPNFSIAKDFIRGIFNQWELAFTEINYDNIESIRGLNVTIVTTANTDEESYWLLKGLGLPLREKPTKQEMEEAA